MTGTVASADSTLVAPFHSHREESGSRTGEPGGRAREEVGLVEQEETGEGLGETSTGRDGRSSSLDRARNNKGESPTGAVREGAREGETGVAGTRSGEVWALASDKRRTIRSSKP